MGIAWFIYISKLNGDVRTSSVGKKSRKKGVEWPRGVPPVEPERGKLLVVDGGASDGAIGGKAVVKDTLEEGWGW
jgi:hypothetical protein